MRRAIAMLAFASLATLQPANAAPAVHQFLVRGLADWVSVTCDTSNTTIPAYPCAFSMVVPAGMGCTEITSDGRVSTACSVSLTGTIQAIPSRTPATGQCTFQPGGYLTLAVHGGVDPAFEVNNTEVPVVVQSALVSYGDAGVRTQARVNTVLPAGGVTVPVLSAGFGFRDIEGDCRTRAGGDPSSDDPGTIPVGPEGVITVVRTA